MNRSPQSRSNRLFHLMPAPSQAAVSRAMKLNVLLAAVLCLSGSGCADSENPLSDPLTSAADDRLLGIWRGQWNGIPSGLVTNTSKTGGLIYLHVGRAGEKFPASMVRVVAVRHTGETLKPAQEFLGFTTVVGDTTYLNLILFVVQDGKQRPVTRLNETGWWKKDAVPIYAFLKYQVDGDKAVVWLTFDPAKARAFNRDQIKGKKGPPYVFTDTTENVLRFVAEAGDDLFNMKEPMRFERVKEVKLTEDR